MNTNGLAKLYDRLSSRERLPLILAASERGDETERERLVRSAPREVFRVPDYFGLGEGLLMQAVFHMTEVLSLSTMYFHASTLLADREFLARATPGRRESLRSTIR